MKKTITLALMMLILACSSLEPVATSSNDLNLQESLKFSGKTPDLIAATKKAFSENDWKILYEGETLPKKNYSTFSNMSHNPFMSPRGAEYDQIAIDKALSTNQAPSYYLQAKTPTSAFSFGAEIFVVVFEGDPSGSATAIAASSGQALEKKKLGSYIQQLTDQLNSRID